MKYALLSLSLIACQATTVSTGPTEAQRRSLDSAWSGTSSEPGWSYDVALGFESEPDYAGSDDTEDEAGLFGRALYQSDSGHRYFVALGEVGAWWDIADDWTLGTVLEFEPGRENTNPALTGFDPVEDTVEGQVSLARRFGDFTVAGVLQPDLLDRGKGFVTFVALGYDKMLTDKLRLAASADVSWGDKEHMNVEFGVTPSAAASSGLDVYDARGGLKSSTIDLGLEYDLGRGLSLMGGLEAEHYYSRASDSPLIRDEGSDWTTGFFLGLRYSF